MDSIKNLTLRSSPVLFALLAAGGVASLAMFFTATTRHVPPDKYHAPVNPTAANPPELVQIDKRFWECTSTHVWHHPKRDGMLTRFGRTASSPAYDSIECDQWSAKR